MNSQDQLEVDAFGASLHFLEDAAAQAGIESYSVPDEMGQVIGKKVLVAVQTAEALNEAIAFLEELTGCDDPAEAKDKLFNPRTHDLVRRLKDKAESTAILTMKLVVEMHGGTIQTVYTNNPHVKITDVVFTEGSKYGTAEVEYHVLDGPLKDEIIETHHDGVTYAGEDLFAPVMEAAERRANAPE